MLFILFKKAYIKFIVLIVLLGFIGCQTTKIEYVDNNKLPEGKTYRILEVFLKDGTSLNVREKEPKFKTKYQGIENVIVYYDNGYIIRHVAMQNVKQIQIEIIESNTGLSVAIILGSVLAVLLFFLLVAKNIGGAH